MGLLGDKQRRIRDLSIRPRGLLKNPSHRRTDSSGAAQKPLCDKDGVDHLAMVDGRATGAWTLRRQQRRD
jgi:hypothetical protein